jgi:hypothetical protein
MTTPVSIRVVAVLLSTISVCACQRSTPVPPEKILRSASDSIAVFDPETGNFLLRFTNTSGFADRIITAPVPAGSIPLSGDWEATGRSSVGAYDPRTSTFFLLKTAADVIVIQFGAEGDLPLIGDWDGDGRDTVGVYRPADGSLRLRNENTPGPPDVVAPLHEKGVPISGDWNGDGRSSPAFFDPLEARFTLFGDLPDLRREATFQLQNRADVPIRGDWDGDGRDDLGGYDQQSGTAILKAGHATDAPETPFTFGLPGYSAVAGKW